MTRFAPVALGLGLVLLLGGFAAGSEPVREAGTSCGSVLHVGTPAAGPSGSPAGRACAERRDGVVRLAVWGAMAVGGALALVGWTASREDGRLPGRRPVARV
jgi:hypothetical protein